MSGGEQETVERETTMQRLMPGYERVSAFRRDQRYTVADRLEERARDSGDRPFIIFEGEEISYAEANRRANRLAHAMAAEDIGRGDVVALLMSNRPEFVIAWLGLAKIGAIAALINTSATGSIFAHALTQTKAGALIFGSELADAVASLPEGNRPARLFEWGEAPKGKGRTATMAGAADLGELIEGAGTGNPDPSLREGITLGDPLYYIFTSGTTGLPKAAVMSHLRFISAGEMMGGLMGLGDEDIFYCVLPLYHGAGGMVVPSAAIAFGISFVLRRRFSASGFWDDVRSHGITAVQYIGEICRYLLNAPERADDADNSLRTMCGAGLREDVWRRFVDRFGVDQVLEGLGSTEANYGITNVDNRIGSVGRIPYPEHSNVRVVRVDAHSGEYARNRNGRLIEVEAGETGELIAEVLEGPSPAGFFEGYTSKEATEAKLLRDAFTDGDAWMRSGDLVRFDEDGYFYFVDRAGDTFRWKSENVSTEEVASVLGGFEGPETVNIYGVKVPGTEGRAGMAALTYTGASRFEPKAFHDFCTAHLADYAVPLFVRLTEAAALTTTFKLRKVELQREGYDPAAAGGDPLFVRDAEAGTYVPLTSGALERLGIAPFVRQTEETGA